MPARMRGSRSSSTAARRRRGGSRPSKPGSRSRAVTTPARRAGTLLGLATVALAAIAFWKGVHNPFVYDDHITIGGNASLVDPTQVRAVLLHFRFRPLVNVSYALDRSIWGPGPLGFHVTNLLLHLLDTWLVFVLARRLESDAGAIRARREPESSEPPRLPAFATVVATLFAVHPMLFQAVGYVSARSELMAAAFVMASLLLVRRWIDRGATVALASAPTLGGALALFACGLASKETAAAFPVLALAWDLLFRLGDDEGRRRRVLFFHLPLLALLAIAGAVRVVSFQSVEVTTLPRSFGSNLMSQLPIAWRYIGLLLFPRGQSILHAAPKLSSFAEPAVWGSLLALLAASAGAWLLRRQAPIVPFAWIWLLIGLVPSSLVPLNELMAEHRVYLASIGLFLLVGAAATALWRRSLTRAARAAEALALVAIAVVLVAATWRRAAVWSDEVRVWKEATDRAPDAWPAHFFLGEALRRRDGCNAALESYRRTIQLDPSNELPHIRIGVCLADQERPALAKEEFEAALAINPKSTQALDYLGRIAGNAGHYDEARDYFERSVAANADNVAALLDLARLHEVVLHQPAEALRLCREAMLHGEVRGQSEQCVRRNEALLARQGHAEQ
jgi:tetratricopeptide (TPR) repeat protein